MKITSQEVSSYKYVATRQADDTMVARALELDEEQIIIHTEQSTEERK